MKRTLFSAAAALMSEYSYNFVAILSVLETVSYRFWRKQMPTFWWIYIIYSIAVLLCTYTYQFTFFPYYWQNGTGLSPQILKAIGLEQFESAELFDRLMMPVAFMVVIILQMHYFHEPFLKLSSLDRYRDENEESHRLDHHRQSSVSRQNDGDSFETQSNFIEDFHSVFNIVASSIHRFMETSRNITWRFAEVHWIKVVCLLVMFSVIKETLITHVDNDSSLDVRLEVTITNIIPVIIVVVCFPFPFLHGFLVTFIFCFTGLQIVMKMLFQLDIVSDIDHANVIASGAPSNPLQPKSSITSLLPNGTGKWIGLDVVEDFPKYITHAEYVLEKLFSISHNSVNNLMMAFVTLKGFLSHNKVCIHDSIHRVSHVQVAIHCTNLFDLIFYVKTIAVSLLYTQQLHPFRFKPLALLLVSCVFWHVIKYRQLQCYRKPGMIRPKPGIIFPEMVFAKMNERLLNFLKCVANYTFYKLGLEVATMGNNYKRLGDRRVQEICFCTTVIAACIRVDALSVLYLLLMLIFLFTHRRDICSRLWPAYMSLLGALLVIQYAACSQIPSILVEYPNSSFGFTVLRTFWCKAASETRLSF
ncbi:hypothetical protein ACTXT7_006752 [Hymenolepis weldensis]